MLLYDYAGGLLLREDFAGYTKKGVELGGGRPYDAEGEKTRH
jgi:hypothetical protein